MYNVHIFFFTESKRSKQMQQTLLIGKELNKTSSLNPPLETTTKDAYAMEDNSEGRKV